MKDYYYILGLENSATAGQIKLAYRKLAKKFHPDVNDGDHFFESRIKEIQEAYEALSDESRKRHYDLRYKNHKSGHADDSTLSQYEEELKRKYVAELRKKEEEIIRKYLTPEQRAQEELKRKKREEEAKKREEIKRLSKEIQNHRNLVNERRKSIKSFQDEINKTEKEINALTEKKLIFERSLAD